MSLSYEFHIHKKYIFLHSYSRWRQQQRRKKKICIHHRKNCKTTRSITLAVWCWKKHRNSWSETMKNLCRSHWKQATLWLCRQWRCVVYKKKIAFYFLFPGSISLILHWTLAFSGFFSFLWAILSVTGTFFFLSLLVSFYRYFFLLYLRCCLQPFDVVLLVLHR